AYLIAFHGGFWLAAERDDRGQPGDPQSWPAVTAVVPARDEADVIARSIGSLVGQDYPGEFRVILVDDASADGTAAAARAVGGGRLEILAGAPLPAGWTGKLWAVHQGIERAARSGRPPAYLLLTDADIAHAPDNLRRLVARAEAGGLVLTSLMARLSTATWAERLLIPAFVFFFAMLFPFAWVNDAKSPVAAAAGGCMLVDAGALAQAGGAAAIRGEIIDDCALARLMKARGPIWLGLTTRAVSLRPYGRFADIAAMVSRSAYAQLRFSTWLLAATVLGMALIYLAPAVFAVFADGPARWLGLAAWLAMAMAFQPMLRFYRRSPLWGLALPLIGALYGAFTVRSAVQVWIGRGGMWKGRAQARAA
ncbi:MAG TPA: glycosyltransferase, partial [Caulobacteraceae bacterium]|nr:glycosyltransferase [Caulobacteraceae bacterium]